MVINNTTTNILISTTLLILDFSVGSENQNKWVITFEIVKPPGKYWQNSFQKSYLKLYSSTGVGECPV